MARDYLTGLGGHFESEAVAGALPKGRNSPQKPAFGLYAEQFDKNRGHVRGSRNIYELVTTEYGNDQPPRLLEQAMQQIRCRAAGTGEALQIEFGQREQGCL